MLIDKGDVDAAIAAADKPMQRTYVWPYQMHGSIGPSCAVADYKDGHIRVWSGTQNPHILRTDLALLLQKPDSEIDVIRLEAAGCYGRNCADDVSADAVLPSGARPRPALNWCRPGFVAGRLIPEHEQSQADEQQSS